MVRAQRFIEIIEKEKLADNIAERGCQVLGGLRAVAKEHGHITNVRGIGSWQAFTCPSTEARKTMLAALREKGLIALASGTESVRLRMPLILSKAEADMVVERVAAAIPAMAKAS
jgi:4-aminobutyrate aminotransferase-like enzyme